MRLELQPVRTIGVRFDNICSAGDIDVMNARNQLGVGDAQMLVAGVDEYPLGVDHRSHGTVEDQRMLSHAFEYIFHSLSLSQRVIRNT